MRITADVTMSLVELDALRDEIKKSKEEAKAFEDKFNQSVADKRTIVRTITKTITKYVKVNKYEMSHSGYSQVPTIEETSTIDYINMDTTLSKIREDLEAQYGEELGSLRAAKILANKKIAELKELHEDATTTITKGYDQVVQELQDKLDGKEVKDQYESELQVYAERIKKLEASLEIEKRRKWFDKLFKL